MELIELGKRLGQIPFGGETSKLFDINPSLSSFTAALKGKGRMSSTSGPSGLKLRTLFNLHPKQSMNAWLGKKTGNAELLFFPPGLSILLHDTDPLARMKHEHPTTTGDQWLAEALPELFGKTASHQCQYRDGLGTFLLRDFQAETSANLASKSPFAVAFHLISFRLSQ